MLYSILHRLSKVVLSLLLVNNAWAFDSSSAYNVVAMSFPANQMVFNRVVLDATQKAQTSVTFTSDVQNGGGRPTHDLNGNPLGFSSQTDSAFIRMRLYDNAGTLINTVTSPTYILRNLGSDPNNQFSTKPGDNLHPWSRASVTYTGDLSDIRFIQLEMVGTDGAFWAGNYGPMWRVPTVTFGADSTNTVYNPEFGIAPNSVRAQGWFNSSNTWAVCGVTSGNVPCVTAVAGVNANMWGGGYDINGGSLAGAVGGYNGALTSTTADNAAATGNPSSPPPPPPPPPPAPTAIYMNNATVKITRAIPTTSNSPPGEGPNNAFDNNSGTKYLNFDKKNAGVTVQLNTGRVVTGFTVTTANDFSGRDPTSYKLYGSNDGVNWTLVKQDALTLSNNRFATSAVIDVGNTTAYAYYFMLFPTTKAGEGCGLDCNSMQIAELTYYYDANSTTTSTASSNTIVDPVAAASTPVYSSGLTTSQQTRRTTNLNENPLGHNAEVTVSGDDNIINIQQIGGRHYVSVDVQGNVNNIDILQTSTVNARHYMEAKVIGGNNSLILQQRDTSKTQFVEVLGHNNSVTTNQKGTGSHYLDVKVTGNDHTAGIIQDGSGNHKATVHLGGTQPWNFQLNQNGNTSQTYSLPHTMSDGSGVNGTCSAIGGCNLTINQQ
jgi:hypothetical protein